MKMNNKQDIKQKVILKAAFIKYYEFIPIVVYLTFLGGFVWEGIDKKQIVIMTILALIMIFIRVKRLIANKPKIIIDANGIRLINENIGLQWNEILDIKIGEKTVRELNSFKSTFNSTVNVKCLIIQTRNNNKIEKIIEKYSFSRKQLNSVFQFYLDRNKATRD